MQKTNQKFHQQSKEDENLEMTLQVFYPFISHAQEKSNNIAKSIIVETNLNLKKNIQTKDGRKYINKKQIPQVLFANRQNDQTDFPKIDLTKVVRHVFKSNYKKLLSQYEGTNRKFIDTDFPAIGTSIGGRWINHNNWKRISQIIPNAVFVNEKIQPSDILQGQIGDCYFLSALAALAENDYRIKNVFPSLQIQPNGIYMARILHGGILRQVVVDDFIPVNVKNQPLFAKASGGKQIWVIILEKCWAKLHKNYAAISGGLPHEVLHAFSGAPTLFNHIPNSKSEQDQLFEVINHAHQNGAVLCCGTKSDFSIQKRGLVIGHAYTLLDVFKYPYRMVRVRNPWGEREWVGRAAETDTQFWNKISQEDKRKLGLQTRNDGTFFMLWQDFCEVFDMVDLCLIQDKASYLCSNITFTPNNGNLFELNLRTPGSVVIAVTQDHIRTFKTDLQKKRGYAKTTLIFAKYNQKKQGYRYTFFKASQYHILPDHYMTFDNLEPGKYMIFAECNWFQNVQKSATVSVYSAQSIQLSPRKDIQPQLFLYEVFMDHARKNTQKKQSLSPQFQQWKCTQFLLGKCDYGYAAYHLDEKSTARLSIQLDQKQYQSKNMSLLKPYAGHGKIRTLVQPGKQLIILFKLDPYKSSPSFTIPMPKVIKMLQ